MTHYLDLVFTKAALNLKAEAAKSYLGMLWWILEPALHVAVFYLVFNSFLARHIDNFALFLFCGQVAFTWFSRTVNNCSNAMMDGRGLMNQVYVPKHFFPLVIILQDLAKSLLMFAVLLAVVIVATGVISPHWFGLVAIIGVQLLFNSLVAITGAVVVPFVPDFRYLISTFMLMMMFLSGIFYDYRQVIPEEFHHLYLLNPLALLVNAYRDVLLYARWPEWNGLLYLACACLLALLLLFRVIRQIDHSLPRVVLE